MSPESAAITVACISTVGSFAVGLLGVVNHRAAREQIAHNTAKTEEVLDQVGNDHQSNLRHDLDQVMVDLARLGGMVGKLTRKVEEALTKGKEHELASTHTVDALHEADQRLRARVDAIAAEVHHHPTQPDQTYSTPRRE